MPSRQLGVGLSQTDDLGGIMTLTRARMGGATFAGASSACRVECDASEKKDSVRDAHDEPCAYLGVLLGDCFGCPFL